MEEIKCSKCGGKMQEGWVTEVYNTFKRASWVQHINWFKSNNSNYEV